MGKVHLREATLETTGTYICEVSTESPNFETDFRLANLTVRGKILGFSYIYFCPKSFLWRPEENRLVCVRARGAENFMKQKEFALSLPLLAPTLVLCASCFGEIFYM